MELNKENVKKIIKIVAFGVVLYWGLQNIAIFGGILGSITKIIFPFILGSCIAFVLNIPMTMIEKRWFKPRKNKKGKLVEYKWKRPISIVISIVIVFGIIAVLIGYIVPELINVINIFIEDLPNLTDHLKEYVEGIMNQYSSIGDKIMEMDISFENISNESINILKNIGSTLISSSLGFVVKLVNGIVTFFIGMVFAVYILLNKEKLGRQVKKLLFAYLSEEKANHILEVANLSNNTFNKFISGQCIEAMILGGLCAIGMLILQIPYAVTIGTLIAFTALIPVVGAFVGGGVGFIMILAVSPLKAVVFLIFLIILQQIEGNIIYPKVVGNSVGLPGMWVLVAVTLGGSLCGIVGMLIGLPIVSVLYTVIKNATNEKLEKKKVEI